MRVAVVIPTYNERENIVLLIRELARILRANKIDFEIIVVDDNSPDKTAEAVLELRNKNYFERSEKKGSAERSEVGSYELRNKLHLISRPKKEGLGKAYLEGFEYALKNGTDYIITMDADFSHNPEDVPRLLKKAKDAKHPNGADVVVGSRYIDGGDMLEPPSKKLISKAAITVARTLLGLKIHDVTAGFKCYSRRFVKSLLPNNIDASGYAFQVETIKKAEENNFKVIEIPIVFRRRKRGSSKLTLREAVESGRALMRIYWNHLLRR